MFLPTETMRVVQNVTAPDVYIDSTLASFSDFVMNEVVLNADAGGFKTDAERRAAFASMAESGDIEGIKSAVHSHLTSNPRSKLSDVKDLFKSKKVKFNPQDPLAHPVHRALKELRDEGKITAHESQWGEPSFSANSLSFNDSYFGSCERDDKGHCLPGGGSGSSKGEGGGKATGKEAAMSAKGHVAESHTQEGGQAGHDTGHAPQGKWGTIIDRVLSSGAGEHGPHSFKEIWSQPATKVEGSGIKAGAVRIAYKVSSVAGKLASTAGLAEHKVAEFFKNSVSPAIARNVAKLPVPAQLALHGTFGLAKLALKAAFSTWTVGQALAEKTALARGASKEQAAEVRSKLSTVDLLAFKVTKVAAFSGVHAAHTPFAVASVVPVASAAYVAASFARNPFKTIKAAGSLIADIAKGTPGAVKDYVKGAISKGREIASRGGNKGAYSGFKKPTGNSYRFDPYGNLIGNDDNNAAINGNVTKITKALEGHDYNDWYHALLSAAIEHTGDIDSALLIADKAYRAQAEGPTDDDTEDDASEYALQFEQSLDTLNKHLSSSGQKR